MALYRVGSNLLKLAIWSIANEPVARGHLATQGSYRRRRSTTLEARASGPGRRSSPTARGRHTPPRQPRRVRVSVFDGIRTAAETARREEKPAGRAQGAAPHPLARQKRMSANAPPARTPAPTQQSIEIDLRRSTSCPRQSGNGCCRNAKPSGRHGTRRTRALGRGGVGVASFEAPRRIAPGSRRHARASISREPSLPPHPAGSARSR